MGGGGPVEIPDWKQYKVGDIKELKQLERLLAARGLKDPWIRNEVWRYDPTHYRGVGKSAMLSLLRGVRWAIPAVIFTVMAQRIMYPKTDDHGGH